MPEGEARYFCSSRSVMKVSILARLAAGVRSPHAVSNLEVICVPTLIAHTKDDQLGPRLSASRALDLSASNRQAT